MSIKLNEMSYPRSEAIDRCASLGEKFIEHFEKSYIGGIDSEDLKHHCAEMQSWYDAVNRMTIKPRAKMLETELFWNVLVVFERVPIRNRRGFLDIVLKRIATIRPDN